MYGSKYKDKLRNILESILFSIIINLKKVYSSQKI